MSDAVQPRGPSDVVAAPRETAATHAPPLHRVASTALLAALGAGPLSAAMIAAATPPPRIGAPVRVAGFMAIAVGLLVAVAALARRLGPRGRTAALLLAAPALTFAGAAAAGWFAGLGASGTHEAAWASTAATLRWTLRRPVFLLLGLAGALPLAALRAGLVPALPSPAPAAWQSLAGGLSGVLLVATLIVVRGPKGDDGKVLVLFAALGAALGGWLALVDRLEPRLAASLSARLVEDRA